MTGRPQLMSSTSTLTPTGRGAAHHASPHREVLWLLADTSFVRTHSVIVKSSTESELYAAVRASSEALGILTLLADFGCSTTKASVGMDASAAIGIV